MSFFFFNAIFFAKNFSFVLHSCCYFSESFNAKNPSDDDKLKAIADHMGSLGTNAEQHYFALSFPINVKLSDGRNVRQLLLRRFTFSN